jgi:hypothetical protein
LIEPNPHPANELCADTCHERLAVVMFDGVEIAASTHLVAL